MQRAEPVRNGEKPVSYTAGQSVGCFNYQMDRSHSRVMGAQEYDSIR